MSTTTTKTVTKNLKLSTASKKGKGTARPPNTPSTSNAIPGLVPQVTLRPPAITLNNTPLRSFDDSFHLTEEEANLLDPLFSLSTPSQTPCESTENRASAMEIESAAKTSDKLLSMRKQYKKTSVALAKAEAHSSFLTSCSCQQQTPKGLTVNVHCSAFLSDLTNVQTQFKETTTNAEQGYLSHLNVHYNTVVNELKQKQSVIRSAMTSLEEQANAEEREAHKVILSKTDSNVQNPSIELARKKKRKLEDLTNPLPKQKKRKQPAPREGSKQRSKSSKEEARPSQPRPHNVSMVSLSRPCPIMPA